MACKRFPALAFIFLLSFPAAAFADQVAYLSPQCPRTPEGMEYFARGADFDFGRNGVAASDSRAEMYYEKALRLGDSAAAMNLGALYQGRRLNKYDQLYRHSLALRFFEQAAAMGCPDGYLAIADAYSRSYSPLYDEEKSLQYLLLAVERGSISAKGVYGKRLYDEAGKKKDDAMREQGIALMEQSLKEGNGHAAPDLAVAYRVAGRAEDMVEALRRGCRLGSKKSLFSAHYLYSGDWFYKQPKDEKYMRRLLDLYDSIADHDPIKPIPDFDKRVPPRPAVPVDKWW